jgi:hypothetical protein
VSREIVLMPIRLRLNDMLHPRVSCSSFVPQSDAAGQRNLYAVNPEGEGFSRKS